MNTHLTDEHLTDEHFADLLAGDEPDSGVEFHLHACELCRQEIASLRNAADDFNALSMIWAHAEAPRRIAAPTRFQRLVGRGGPLWGLGLTAALFAGMVATHIPNIGRVAGEAPAVAGNPTGSAMPELAADNRLMQSIDHELQSSSQPAVPLDELRGSARKMAQPQTAAITN